MKLLAEASVKAAGVLRGTGDFWHEPVEICCFYLIDIELLRAARGKLLRFIEVGGFRRHKFACIRKM